MIYHEEHLDLFSVDDSYYLAHCISADLALGAGIAVEFDKRFNMRSKLLNQCPGVMEYMENNHLKGSCIVIDRVFNLITKKYYYNKPTYESITQAIESMRDICVASNINKIAMPTIGCGLDRLSWRRVNNIITNAFKYTNIEILVCIR